MVVRQADPHVVAYIKALVEKQGVRPVGRKLRFADATVARLCAGLPVTEGVAHLALIRVRQMERDEAA